MIGRAAVLALALGAALGCERPSAPGPAAGALGGRGAAPPVGADAGVAARARAADGGTGATGAGADAGPAVPAADARPPTVRVLVRSAGPTMHVSWGRQQLGTTPLTLRRPRDSGPMDLVLRAGGYFPTHARAYTYKDDTVVVRPTRIADRMNLLGARKELPPEGDGGVPPAAGAPAPGAPPPGAPPLAPSGTPGR
jgi:hypothetical protein